MKVAAAVRDKDAISTAALLDLLRAASDHGYSAPPRRRDAQPEFYPDQIAPLNAGRPRWKHRYTRLGSPRPHNEIVPNDLQRKL